MCFCVLLRHFAGKLLSLQSLCYSNCRIFTALNAVQSRRELSFSAAILLLGGLFYVND